MLETISKPQDGPVVMTICGDAGAGKTSLAAEFPNPIVIRAEDGLQSIPMERRPDAFPLVQTADDVFAQIKALQGEHEYKTLIIDSVTALERLFTDDIVAKDPKNPKSINQANGGYGAGLAALASMHQRVRKGVEILRRRKGMHIVFIAHADTETIDLPDADPYTRYTLRLGKRSVAPYVDDADVVGFLKLETFLKGDDNERKKAISDGTRQLVVKMSAANVSKNRFGIEQDLTYNIGENPLTPFISTLKETQQ